MGKKEITINATISNTTTDKAMQCLVDNGIDPDEAPTVLQALGYILLNEELEDVINWDFAPYHLYKGTLL